MQEETNEKTIALYIKTGKLTAQQLQKAMKALLAQMKKPVSYTHLRAHETDSYLVCRLLLEKKKKPTKKKHKKKKQNSSNESTIAAAYYIKRRAEQREIIRD